MAKAGKDLLDFIRANGLDEYGSVIPVETVREVLKLEFPDTGTQKEFSALQLSELAGVDYVRNALLNEGKYLKGDGSAYRILLPSENHDQIFLYMASAENKLKRALKLEKTTPVTSSKPSNVSARAMMKLGSISARKKAA